MIYWKWSRSEWPSKKWKPAQIVWVSFLLIIPGCTSPAGSKDAVTTFAVPTAAAASTSHDTTVTLYYNPADCFTCFGVLGHWAAVANTTGVKVRLSLDDQPDEKTLQVIRRMRLPFELGITSPDDKHSRRARATMKELLTVRDRVVDSAIVQSGAITSPLLRQMNATK